MGGVQGPAFVFHFLDVFIALKKTMRGKIIGGCSPPSPPASDGPAVAIVQQTYMPLKKSVF